MRKYNTWEALKIISENPNAIFRWKDETFTDGNYIELKSGGAYGYTHVNRYGSGQADSKFLEREWTLVSGNDTTWVSDFVRCKGFGNACGVCSFRDTCADLKYNPSEPSEQYKNHRLE